MTAKAPFFLFDFANRPVLMTPERLDQLEAWVRTHYRDRLAVADLADPALLEESRRALAELATLLDLA